MWKAIGVETSHPCRDRRRWHLEDCVYKVLEKKDGMGRPPEQEGNSEPVHQVSQSVSFHFIDKRNEAQGFTGLPQGQSLVTGRAFS